MFADCRKRLFGRTGLLDFGLRGSLFRRDLLGDLFRQLRVAFRGDLASGDTIDVVATYSDATVYVARDIQLLANPATVSGGDGATITIAVEEPDTVLAIANALDAAQVFVLRSDPDGGDELPAPFRPDVGGR